MLVIWSLLKVLEERVQDGYQELIPGIVIKITVHLSYLVKLATGKTVRHQVDNVKKRHNMLDFDEATQTSFEQPTNVDISLPDTTVESSYYYTSFDLY